MPTRDLPSLLWLVAIAGSLLPFAAGLVRNGRLAGGPEEPTGSSKGVSGAVLLVLALLGYLVSPSPDKGAITTVSLLVGGGLGLLFGMGPAHLLWRDETARDALARAGLWLACLVLTDVFMPDPVLQSYALVSFLLGLSAVALPLALVDHPRAGNFSASLAMAGLVAAAVIWGDRALPDGHLGSSWALAFGALSLAFSYLASYLPRVGAPFAGAVLTAAVAVPLGAWIVRLAPGSLLPGLFGLVLAMVLAGYVLLTERAERAGPLPTLALILVAGGTLLLANRLYGMYGMSLAGLGLFPVVVAGLRAVPLGGLVMAAFAGRALLQVFLDRTYLRQYGADLTHVYTSFGLLSALLVPYALLALRQAYAPRAVLLGIEALVALALPWVMGYFLHVDPVASYLAGLLMVTFVLGLLGEAQLTRFRFHAVLPPLVVAAGSASLIGAKWMITVMNAPRMERLAVFLILLLLLALYLVVLMRRPRPEVAA
ncbi:MAG TPA: hypothetical protein V6D05_14395 [Stenomitos sp.]